MRLRIHARASVALLLAGMAVGGFSLTFTHLAGSAGGAGFEDGDALTARFRDGAGVAVDASGNVYVADTNNHTIRRVSPAGEVTTFAGVAETPGFMNGYRSNARFHYPRGLALDGSGNLYVADSLNHSIRKITPAGQVTTLAGLAIQGFTNANGSSARFNFPNAVTVDSSGNVYVADTNNQAIRMITPAGDVTTVTTSGLDHPRGVAWDATTNTLFVADTNDAEIVQIALPGGATSVVASGSVFFSPWGIAVDATGLVYVSDAMLHKVVSVTGGGTVTLVAGFNGYPGPQDGGGSVARFRQPTALSVAGSSLYVADTGNHTVRKIDVSGGNLVTTFAGIANAPGFVNGTGAAARFNNPGGIAYYPGPSGFAYVADTDNHAIRRVSASGVVTTLAGGVQGYTNGAGTAAQFHSPQGVALTGSATSAFIADTGNHVIRFVDGAGNVSLYAGQPGSPGVLDGDRLTTAQFSSPTDVAAGPLALYVADSHLRRIEYSTGIVTTLMALGGLRGPENRIGLAVDSDDNVYLTGSGVVFKRPPGGPLQSVAGSSGNGPLDGTGSAARFAYPGPSAIASGWPYTTGAAYVLDLLANQVRRVDFTTGAVTTAGGKVTAPLPAFSFHPNYGTSPGTGTFSRFHRPRGAAFSLNAMVITEGHTIRHGGPEITDRAVIDDATGAVGQPRQLDTFPQTATSWTWSVIRRPTGSTATLSSTSVRNPTFTPDVADLYVFRCVATSSNGSSISTVALQGSASAVALELVGYPGPRPANVEFPLPVSAKDPFGNLAVSYAGTVHFTSSDPAATLPGDYTFTAGDNGTRSFSGTLRTPGTQSITVTDLADGSLVATIYLTVVLPAPTGLVATATSPTSIELTWNASFGASTYQIAPWNGVGYSPTISGLTTTSFTISVSAGTSHAFRVRAVDGSLNLSAYSNADVATTIFFADDPLAAGDTVLLIHLTEARQAIDAMRVTAVLAPLSYTDPSPVAGVTPIRGAHISELRTGLNEARTKLQLVATSFTDPVLSSAVAVKAVHIQEVRNAVK